MNRMTYAITVIIVIAVACTFACGQYGLRKKHNNHIQEICVPKGYVLDRDRPYDVIEAEDRCSVTLYFAKEEAKNDN